MKKLTLLLMGLLLIPALVIATTIIISNKPINTEEFEFNSITGDALSVKGAWEEAVNFYEKAYELNPKDRDITNKLANAYYKVGRYSEATDLLKGLVSKYSTVPSYNYDYAINIMMQIKAKESGEIEELELAYEHFKKAYELKKGYLKAKENMQFVKNLIEQYENEES